VVPDAGSAGARVVPDACGFGSSAVGIGGSGVAGTGLETGWAFSCKKPQPYYPGGCLIPCDGFIPPPAAAACPSQLPPDVLLPAVSAQDECHSDSDCTAGPNGWCVVTGFGSFGLNINRCAYGCVTDADCAANQICLCGAVVGGCVASNCVSDA